MIVWASSDTRCLLTLFILISLLSYITHWEYLLRVKRQKIIVQISFLSSVVYNVIIRVTS